MLSAEFIQRRPRLTAGVYELPIIFADWTALWWAIARSELMPAGCADVVCHQAGLSIAMQPCGLEIGRPASVWILS
jgi:hypothetical protein